MAIGARLVLTKDVVRLLTDEMVAVRIWTNIAHLEVLSKFLTFLDTLVGVALIETVCHNAETDTGEDKCDGENLRTKLHDTSERGECSATKREQRGGTSQQTDILLAAADVEFALVEVGPYDLQMADGILLWRFLDDRLYYL